MQLSDEKVREILELKDRITEKIEEHEEEIEFLKRNLDVLDSMIKQTSFTKASSLHSDVNPPKLNNFPNTFPCVVPIQF